MSKKVIIIRHAKSSWSQTGLADFDRPLNERGLKDALFMANRLRDLGEIPEILISSNANRAQSTAKYFAEILDKPLELNSSLYHGYPEDYLNALSELSDDIKMVALFGHNPGITYIANMISQGCTDNIPTCGIIIAQTNLNSWASLNWKDFKLESLLFPKKDNND